MAIKRSVNDAWQAAADLFTIIYRDQAPYNVLDNLPPNAELTSRQVTFSDGSTYDIEQSYFNNCDTVMFLREIASLPSKEKSAKWRERYAAKTSIVTSLDGVNAQPEEVVRCALGSIFGVLSDEVHQAAARFESDGQFVLPRAGSAFSFAQILAMASIVANNGLTPQYPTAEVERTFG